MLGCDPSSCGGGVGHLLLMREICCCKATNDIFLSLLFFFLTFRYGHIEVIWLWSLYGCVVLFKRRIMRVI
jgi:hypothetical protein